MSWIRISTFMPRKVISTRVGFLRRPSEDGIITAVEAYDVNGELIVSFFGQRKPGIPELESWRDVVIKN